MFPAQRLPLSSPMSQIPANLPIPRKIIATLLPHLKIAAAYAHKIQSRIVEQPEKDYPDNIFASALTDADLSVQTFVEVLLLGYFPELRFYGEEHEKAFNTKYFRGITLGEQGDYLVTLDPIDGTRFYADGHSNYQIILNVLNADDFEATLLIHPAQDRYIYALRDRGAYIGKLADALDDCRTLRIEPEGNIIYLGGGAGQYGEKILAQFGDRYQPYDLYQEYSSETQVPNMGSVLDGAYVGSILGGAQFIDGAAIAFLAREAGCIVTQHDGSPMPPLHECKNYRWPGLLIATSEAVHRDLLAAVKF